MERTKLVNRLCPEKEKQPPEGLQTVVTHTGGKKPYRPTTTPYGARQEWGRGKSPGKTTTRGEGTSTILTQEMTTNADFASTIRPTASRLLHIAKAAEQTEINLASETRHDKNPVAQHLKAVLSIGTMAPHDQHPFAQHLNAVLSIVTIKINPLVMPPPKPQLYWTELPGHHACACPAIQRPSTKELPAAST